MTPITRNEVMGAKAIERLEALIKAHAVPGNPGSHGIRFHVNGAGSIVQVDEIGPAEPEVKMDVVKVVQTFRPSNKELCGQTKIV